MSTTPLHCWASQQWHPGDLRSSIISHDRISAELGWKPQSTLEDGLRRTVEWFAER